MLEDVASGKKPKSSAGNWLLWWQVSASELQRQVADYRKVKFGTARFLSAGLLVASAVLTLLIGLLGSGQSLSLLDVALFLILALFVGLGHRWAMIGAMVLWTFEKAFMMIAPNLNGFHSFPVTQIIWWCAYMHAFYLAFRVEQERRKPIGAIADVFN